MPLPAAVFGLGFFLHITLGPLWLKYKGKTSHISHLVIFTGRWFNTIHIHSGKGKKKSMNNGCYSECRWTSCHYIGCHLIWSGARTIICRVTCKHSLHNMHFTWCVLSHFDCTCKMQYIHCYCVALSVFKWFLKSLQLTYEAEPWLVSHAKFNKNVCLII